MTSSERLDQTTLKQRRAADPKASSFVSANAGSGKTYVLVSRILRLLLDGVDPSKILALTYTKAAAANMANRVFHDLSEWVSLDDDALTEKIFRLDGEAVTREKLRRARQLFARAVETPGGLKIQTIHAFAERILHLFPFEANVPAQFDVIDDALQNDLLTAARNAVIEGRFGTDPQLEGALQRVAAEAGESGFDKVIKMALPSVRSLRDRLVTEGAFNGFLDELRSALNLLPHETGRDIDDQIFAGRFDDQQCEDIATRLSVSSVDRDRNQAAALTASRHATSREQWEKHYFDIFFKKTMEPRADSQFVTKDLNKSDPSLRPLLLNERDRLTALLDRRKSVLAFERTSALLLVARAIVSFYEREKIRRGALDYDDLIGRTRALLKRAGAQWVLYKLDRGIDHLLIDEAQDTSPEQWDILSLLTSDFHAGESARRINRTVFAVGDPKQSIYSFQGADPAAFADYRALFKKRVDGLVDSSGRVRQHFHPEELTLSFRSAPEILTVVDAVFNVPAHYQGLQKDAAPTDHISKREQSVGLVELWPLTEAAERDDPDDWTRALDEPGDASPQVQLARQIATHCAELMAPHSQARLEGDHGQWRRVTPGDILILVRKRGGLFETILRALKDQGLPVAGADRLALSGHIAVMDLVALGEALLTPEDDLTLATVLKSPLFGCDEDDLLALAHSRPGSLIEALQTHQTRASLIEARVRFDMFDEAAKRLGVFGFYAHVLGPCGGRRAFEARLGTEAADAIDEFLRLALEHDHRGAPSLSSFLADFRKADLEIKRDMEGGRDEIRVMTVHGAKGLEAPIVYLPDTTGPAVTSKLDPLFDMATNDASHLPIWSMRQPDDSGPVADARERAKARAEDEHRRLFYVALTRARDRLYIAGAKGKASLSDGSWYAMAERSLTPMMQPVTDGSAPEGALRLQSSPFPHADIVAPLPIASVNSELPAWCRAVPSEEVKAEPPLKPSSAIDAADRAERPFDTEHARQARRRGTLIHALLELLPSVADERRTAVAEAWLKAKAPNSSDIEREEMANSVLALLKTPSLASLFGPNSRAEAAIAGYITTGDGKTRAVSGQIDRLAVLNSEVLIADYKTHAIPPSRVEDVSEATVVQLAVYRALMRSLYPDRPVRCLVIYTATVTPFEIPESTLDSAFAKL